jgi:hypothetical protein
MTKKVITELLINKTDAGSDVFTAEAKSMDFHQKMMDLGMYIQFPFQMEPSVALSLTSYMLNSSQDVRKAPFKPPVLKCTPVWNLKIKLRIIVETQKSHTH